MTIINTEQMLDIHKPESVQISVDASNKDTFTVWVNVDGICRLRVIGVPKKQFQIDSSYTQVPWWMLDGLDVAPLEE